MITNFALSLSFDGIELLHRVPRGWRRIGRVDVESETLDADLAALREKAEAIEPDGLRSKLIIPLDQIKYTAIDGTRTTQDDIDAVLEGATPYALDELVIDCERFGGRTHIAAVARETLKEAEAFAAAHGFQPVAFVAVPEPFTFQKEVFFGPTDMARQIVGPDALIERDSLPVMVVGTRIKSRLLVFDLPQEMEEEVYKDDLAELLAPKKETPKPIEEPVAQIEEVEASQAQADLDAQPELDLDLEPVEDAAPGPEELEIAPVEEITVPTPIWIDAIPAEFHPPAVEPQAAEPLAVEVKDPLIPENPVFATLPLLDAVIAEYHPSQAKPAKPALVAVASGGSKKAPKLGAMASATKRASAQTLPRSKPALIAAGIAAGALLLGGLIWSQQVSEDIANAPVATPAETVATAGELPAETPNTAVPDGPAPIIPDVEIANFGTADTDDSPLPMPSAEGELAIASAPDALTLPPADAGLSPVQAPPAPPEPETAQAAVGAPVLRGQVLSPAEAESIYAATGVWQRSARFFDVPSGIIILDFVRPMGTTPPDRIAQPDVPQLEGLDTDLSFIAPANPPAPEVIFPLDENGLILATPEGTLTPEGAIVFAGLPDLNINLRPELSQADLDRMKLLAPAPEGVIIIAGRPDPVPPLRPANARLPETAEASQTDEALAQALTETATDEAAPTPGSVGLAALELQNSGAVALDPAVVEDNAIIDLRPQLRPQGLAAEDPGTPDITDILAGIETDDATLRFDNSTALAVVLSPRPDVRPSNFGRTVAAAQARQQPRQAAPAAPAPVTAAAPVPPQNFAPVPGGVARAATQEDVIRLREINLIGVYGRPNARRALVRLSNGRYVRVEVGSALDGGQVTAIGDDALNYVKRGRTFAIELPSG